MERKKNKFRQTPFIRSVLTRGGFNPSEFCKVISFDSQLDAETFLAQLIEDQPKRETQGCYVMKDANGRYAIVKNIPYPEEEENNYFNEEY